MTRRLNANFWTSFNAFFQIGIDLLDHHLVETITRVASGKEPLIRHKANGVLPDSEVFATQWAQVSEFINTCLRNDWNHATIVDQLRLVASGVRDVRLHDNCSDLPLSD
jgi:hypothetical protein